MKTNNDFINYYNTKYKQILKNTTEELLKDLKEKFNKTIILIIIVDVIPSLLFILFAKTILLKIRLLLSVAYSILIIFKSYINVSKFNKIKSKELNESIIKDLLFFITNDKDLDYTPDNRISKSSFEKTNLFNLDELKYNGSNYIRLKYNEEDMILGDYEIYTNKDLYSTKTITRNNKTYIQTIKRKKRQNILNGSYIGGESLKNVYCNIYLIPKEDNLLKKVNKYIKLEEENVELENLKLSKKYTIYSNNEIKTRQLLTLKYMEKINELEKILPNKKYIIFKDTGRFSILIQDYSIEKIKEKKLKMINNEIDLNSILEILEELNKYFKIYDLFSRENI